MKEWLPTAAVWFAICLIPGIAWVWFIWKSPPKRASSVALWGTVVLGVVCAWAVTEVGKRLVELADLSEAIITFGDPIGILYVLLFFAPLGEASIVAAAWPAFRLRHFDEEYDGVVFSTASATGFAIGQAGLAMAGLPLSVGVVSRVMILALAHPLIAPMWGYFLGKVRRSRTPPGKFAVAWMVSSIVYGLMLHMVTVKSLLALLAAVPVLVGLAFVTWWTAHDLLTRFGRLSLISARTVMPSLPTPSIATIRQALRRSDGSYLVRWIVVGTVSTTGVVLTMAAGAVWLGHQVGLDFSTIGGEDLTKESIVPLGLLMLSVLGAFPIAGYLIAKASGSPGVLEPALSAALAIAVGLVMLGLAAPLAMVFALAFAPIAFGFACIGAWFGLSR